MEIVKEKVKDKKILVVPSDYSGCGYQRMIEPMANIDSENIEFEFNQTSELITETALQYNAIILQRPCMGKIDEFIAHAKAKGVIIILETDDDLLNIPKNNPMHDFMLPLKKTYKRCLELADYIHVSTEELRSAVGSALTEKTFVFENGIDFSKYPQKTESKYITWAGGTSHKDSLEIIRPVIKELISNNRHVLLASNKEWLNSIGFEESKYLKIAPWKPFIEQHHLHLFSKINLAPLRVTQFNKCKSELRSLEAAVYGVPTVATDISPYTRFNSHRNASVLIKNKFSDWMKAIDRLLKDDEYYKQKSEDSFKTATDYYNLIDINKKRDEWWNKVLFN